MTARKLDERGISDIILQRQNGTKLSVIATQFNVTPQRICQIYSHYLKTGSVPTSKKTGRPSKEPTKKEIRLVKKTYKRKPQGMIRLAKQLRNSNIHISYDTVQKIMIAEGFVTPLPRKRKRRSWIRFERKYSNAMWHVDWHVIDDPRWGKLYLICYLDDASRCITGFGVFKSPTSANAVSVLRKAIKKFGSHAQILSDRGTQFTAAKKPKNGRKKLTLFEAELSKRKIKQILARANHPQTNGKLERFFGTFESEIKHSKSIRAYINYYNKDRLYLSLDIDNGETPLKAFKNKRASAKIRKNPNWANENSDEFK